MELLETLKLSNKVILNIDQGHIWSRLAFWNILWLFGQFGILTFKTFEGSLKWEKKLSVWLKSKCPGTVQNLRRTFHIPRDNFPFPWSSLRPVKTSLRSVFDNWPPLRPRKRKVLSWNVKFAYDFVLFLDIYFPAIQNYYSFSLLVPTLFNDKLTGYDDQLLLTNPVHILYMNGFVKY